MHGESLECTGNFVEEQGRIFLVVSIIIWTVECMLDVHFAMYVCISAHQIT